MSEVQKITSDWLRKKEEATIRRVVPYLGASGVRELLEIDIRLLPGTLMDTLEDALITKDETGSIVPGRVSMNRRNRAMVQLSLGLSQAEVDELWRKPMNLVDRIIDECNNINGQGTFKEIENEKNEEGEVGPTSD